MHDLQDQLYAGNRDGWESWSHCQGHTHEVTNMFLWYETLCLVSACSVWYVKLMLKSFPHTNHHSHLWSVILFARAFLCLHFYLLHFKHLKLFPIYACAFPLYSMCFVLRDHIISLTLGSLLLICRWKMCFVLVYHSAVFCAALIHLFSVAYLEPELATEG